VTDEPQVAIRAHFERFPAIRAYMEKIKVEARSAGYVETIFGRKCFIPGIRDANLARPWAVPGTPGLRHRVGGLEKQDVTGNISYDAANHERMTHLRAAKVAKIASTPIANGSSEATRLPNTMIINITVIGTAIDSATDPAWATTSNPVRRSSSDTRPWRTTS